MKVPQEVDDVFEAHDMSVLDIESDGFTIDVELESHTDGGEDMLHMLYIDTRDAADVRSWWQAFNKMREGFDPYEHAAGWMSHLDETPFTCYEDLFKDAIDYDKELKAIEQELSNLVFKSEPRKFYVYTTMNVSVMFCIQADSKEDAFDKMRVAVRNKRFFDSVKDDFDFDEVEMFDTWDVAEDEVFDWCCDDVDPIDIDSFIDDVDPIDIDSFID